MNPTRCFLSLGRWTPTSPQARTMSGCLHIGAGGAVEVTGDSLVAFGVDLAGFSRITAGDGGIQLATEFGAGLIQGHLGLGRGDG